MAGIIAFLDKHAHGHGGKLVLFCFNDDTYEQIEEELDQCDYDFQREKILARLRKESPLCVFAEINIDSFATVATEAR